MLFPEYYQACQGSVISFEVYPPKTDKGMETLHAIVPDLLALRPDFMTVTYGALGSVREKTLDIATFIKQQHGLETACHLTCVGSSRAELDAILIAFSQAGIRNIVALRGDAPQGETAFVPPPDGYHHGNELVTHIRDFEQRHNLPAFGIAVAGYPEKHLEAPDMATDLENLKRKVDAGADIVVTQLFYDNANFFRFLDLARAAGINVPIVPGLLPVHGPRQLVMAERCGSIVPDGLRRAIDRVADDPDAMEQVGVDHCIAQATELLEQKVDGIHFYVLNRATHMQAIVAALPSCKQCDEG